MTVSPSKLPSFREGCPCWRGVAGSVDGSLQPGPLPQLRSLPAPMCAPLPNIPSNRLNTPIFTSQSSNPKFLVLHISPLRRCPLAAVVASGGRKSCWHYRGPAGVRGTQGGFGGSAAGLGGTRVCSVQWFQGSGRVLGIYYRASAPVGHS